MKKGTKILIAIYIVIAIMLTFNLLTYNKFNISQIGTKEFIKLNKDLDNYQKGSLLIVTEKDEYLAGDNVFYCVLKDEKCDINYGNITTMMGDAPLINGETVSKKLLVASAENIAVIPVIGGILNVLESRTIFLCLIVIPILAAFIYEAYTLTKETKKENKKAKNKK